MSVTPRLVGRVSEPIRQRPQVLDYTALLERDVEAQQETIDRLRVRLRSLKAQVEHLQAERRARIRHKVPRPSTPVLVQHIQHAEVLGRVTLVPGVVLDSDAWRIVHRGGTVQFSPTEWLLLQQLAAKRGHVVPFTVLVGSLIEFANSISDPMQSLRVNMSRLRLKLRTAGVDHLLTTVPYSGYRLEVAS